MGNQLLKFFEFIYDTRAAQPESRVKEAAPVNCQPEIIEGLKAVFGDDNITESNFSSKIKYLAMIQHETFSFLKDVKRKDWWKVSKSDLTLIDLQSSLYEYHITMKEIT